MRIKGKILKLESGMYAIDGYIFACPLYGNSYITRLLNILSNSKKTPKLWIRDSDNVLLSITSPKELALYELGRTDQYSQ